MIIGSLLESMAEVAELIEDRDDINLQGLSTGMCVHVCGEG